MKIISLSQTNVFQLKIHLDKVSFTDEGLRAIDVYWELTQYQLEA